MEPVHLQNWHRGHIFELPREGLVLSLKAHQELHPPLPFVSGMIAGYLKVQKALLTSFPLLSANNNLCVEGIKSLLESTLRSMEEEVPPEP